MVLTFTGSLSVAEAGRGDVRAMLIGTGQPTSIQDDEASDAERPGKA